MPIAPTSGDPKRTGAMSETSQSSPPQIVQHQRRGRLGRADHAGDARARMRARADEIEVGDAIVAIVDAEQGGLRQQRLQAEGGAQMRVQVAARNPAGV